MTGRKSVADKFGPAATSLSNRLPPRPADDDQPDQPEESTVPPAATAEAAPEAPAADSPSAVIEEPRPASPTPSPPASDTARDTNTTVQINVHLLPHVIALAEHGRNGRSNADIVLDALDQAGHLPTLLDQHRGQPSSTSGTSRFRRNGTTRTRTSTTPRRPWTFRLSRDDVDVLDDLTREAGAASRSELVEAALAAAHR